MAFFIAYITISCPIENNNAVRVTTTDSIEGRGISRYYDPIAANVVIGTHIFSDIVACPVTKKDGIFILKALI
ncbi:hypothetical protein GCM10022218_28270 [Sphingobacterium ginsenosidimutans]|uniref:Uncharacterized protein n=1 Tax=Sphingobacterium ginsenosidimutans TaxID=687845 RepID=A0ABP8A5D7_9SPHI